jgi:catechol 2,3-dioxygenase-like lactoylglutathione lyase family enzyme
MTDLRESPQWRGINHLALVTPDMDATVRFYHGVLGMPLVSSVMAGPMRHYFFEIAPGNTVAFFEVKDAHAFAKPAGIPDTERAAQFDHLSFNLPDQAALHALRDRLAAHGCEVTEIVDHYVVESIYFTDPNGIALEASWWAVDVTGHPADYGDDKVFADPDPVPAVRELMEQGELAWTPTTGLTQDPISDPV